LLRKFKKIVLYIEQVTSYLKMSYSTQNFIYIHVVTSLYTVIDVRNNEWIHVYLMKISMRKCNVKTMMSRFKLN